MLLTQMWMKRVIDLSRFCFCLFFVLLPFQVDTLVLSGKFNFSGFFNPYLSHFIYLSDVFFLLSLFFLGVAYVYNKGAKGFFRRKAAGNLVGFLYLAVFLIFIFISYLTSVYKLNTLFYSLRFFEFFIAALLLAFRFIRVRSLMYGFIGVMSFVSFIGIFQYFLQESLGLRFLGEPLIESAKLGVAKVGLLDKNVLRIYGTFAHPNIFAGFLVFTIFFIIHLFQRAKVLFSLLLIVSLLALLLTFSRSAFLALFLGLFFLFAISNVRLSFRSVVLVLSLFFFFVVVLNLKDLIFSRLVFFDFLSVDERQVYLSIAKKIFLDNWWGVGAGNFTFLMQDYFDFKILPWLLQPVHNIFILNLVELGLFGFLSFILFVGYLFYNLLSLGKRSLASKRLAFILMSLLIVVATIGLFDHYLLSLYQGQGLLFMLFGLSLGVE